MGSRMGEECVECWCGTSVYVLSLAHHILHDHIGAKSWACGRCDFQTPDLNALILHAFRQRHDPRSIISPSLERMLGSVRDVWVKETGGEEETDTKTDHQETTNSPSTSSRDDDAVHELLDPHEAVVEPERVEEESDTSHTDSRGSPFQYSPSKRLRLMPEPRKPQHQPKSEALDLGMEIRRKLEAAANRASPSALTRLWVMKGLGGGLPLRGTPSPSLPLIPPHMPLTNLPTKVEQPDTNSLIPIVRDSLDPAGVNRSKSSVGRPESRGTESSGGAEAPIVQSNGAGVGNGTNGTDPFMPPWNRICALCGLSVRVYNNRNQIHRGYIQTHVHRRHLDVYGWACSECGKHFKSKDTARAHVRGSHADAPAARAALTCPPDLYARQTKEAMIQCFPDIDMSFYKVITE